MTTPVACLAHQSKVAALQTCSILGVATHAEIRAASPRAQAHRSACPLSVPGVRPEATEARPVERTCLLGLTGARPVEPASDFDARSGPGVELSGAIVPRVEPAMRKAAERMELAAQRVIEPGEQKAIELVGQEMPALAEGRIAKQRGTASDRVSRH